MSQAVVNLECNCSWIDGQRVEIIHKCSQYLQGVAVGPGDGYRISIILLFFLQVEESWVQPSQSAGDFICFIDHRDDPDMFQGLIFALDGREDIVEGELDEMLEFLHGFAVVHQLDFQFEYLEEGEGADPQVAGGGVELVQDLIVISLDIRRQVDDLPAEPKLLLVVENPLIVEHILPNQRQRFLCLLVQPDPSIDVRKFILVLEDIHEHLDVDFIDGQIVDLRIVLLHPFLQGDLEQQTDGVRTFVLLLLDGVLGRIGFVQYQFGDVIPQIFGDFAA